MKKGKKIENPVTTEGDHCANGRRFPEARSLRSRRVELVGARKNGRARARHASLPLARLFYFQAPAKQVKRQIFESVDKILSVMIEMRLLRWKFRMKTISFRT